MLKKASIGLPLPFCRFASLCSLDTCIHGQAPVEVRVRLGLEIGPHLGVVALAQAQARVEICEVLGDVRRDQRPRSGDGLAS